MTERGTGRQDVPGGPMPEDEFDQTGRDQEQLGSRSQPMDEPEFDRVKGDRGDAGSRGQPMDEPEFD